MYNIIFKNAIIVDGTGNKRFVSDLAIKDGKIVKIDNNIDEKAEETIDATGLILSPGFIDSHGHNDFAMLSDGKNELKLEQGVTTEVCGQCGLTIAPVSEHYYDERNAKSFSIESLPGISSRRKFTTTAKWFDYIDSIKLGTNHLVLVGHGTIRETVMGYDNRVASSEELEEMKSLVREAMESGALGLSTGLAYAPGNFSPDEEIIELAKIVAEYGGLYCSHLRNQADRLKDSINETINISEKSGCTTVVSHLKSIGKPNWGQIKDCTKLIEDAHNRGVDIYFDAYPYVAGSTTLAITLPPSILAGGRDTLVSELKDKNIQKYIEDQFSNPTESWENAIGNNGYESIFISKADGTPEAVGKTIPEYAGKLNISNFEAYIKLFIDNDGNIRTINFVMSEEDLISAISHHLGTIGSDGGYIPSDKTTHPRAVGTYPRYLGRYVRNLNILPLEDAIKKITSFPAKIYSLKNKGLIKTEYDADITIFNYDTIIDNSDFNHPFNKNTGIEYVIVNGKIAVHKGEYVGVNNGKLIRFSK